MSDRQTMKSYKSLSENNALVKSLLGPPEAKDLISVMVRLFLKTLDSSTIKTRFSKKVPNVMSLSLPWADVRRQKVL